MATVTMELLRKSFDQPDEVRELPKAHVDVVRLGGYSAMKVRFEPGWRWSEHVKPRVGTETVRCVTSST